ncbi:hypothetical protein [Moorena producens]|uniref:hypothetical protein n=1 Tax=Moorena producens TaxID=1155739 RepID=UPI003C71E27C
MRYTGFFPSCLLPLAFPSWEGLGVGYSCLLPSPPGQGLGVGYSCLFSVPMFPKIPKLCTSPN